MLSRVADAIYWMCRYVERAENVARFVDVNLHLLLEARDAATQQWEPLVITTGDAKVFRERVGASTQANVTEFLAFDKMYPSSILSCLRAARENARSVREVISSEMWEQLNRFYLRVLGAAQQRETTASPYEFYKEIKQASHLFVGIMDTTMSHGEAWHFGRLGRLLERADKTSRILDVKYFILLPSVQDVGTPLDDIQWAALLRSASGFEMYRKRYQKITPQNVAEFLILDRDFPRSLHYSVIKAEESLHAISGSPTAAFSNAAEQRLGRVRSALDYAEIEDISSVGLHEYLDRFQTDLNRVGDAVFETFFALRPVAGGAPTGNGS